jgi:hypothetical protein
LSDRRTVKEEDLRNPSFLFIRLHRAHNLGKGAVINEVAEVVACIHRRIDLL